MNARIAVILAALVFASGCSGGAGNVAPAAGSAPAGGAAPAPPSSAKRVQARVVIRIPKRTTTSAVARKPHYVGAGTQSMSIAVNSGTPVIANLTPSSPDCVPASGNTPLTCTVVVPAPAGNDTFAVVTYDGLGGSGNVLSQASITQTLTSGQLNSVNLALSGIVNAVALSLTNPPLGFPATVPLTVTATDADGNTIVGTAGYAYPLTLTDSDSSGATTLSTTTVTGPSTTVTVAYTGAALQAGATFGATATGLTSQNTQVATLVPAGWQSLAAFPNTVRYAAAGAIGNELYVAGGQTPGYSNAVQAYNTVAGSWSSVASLPNATSGIGSAVVNGIFYVIGGYTNFFPYFEPFVEAYDPVANSWSIEQSMSTPRVDPCVGVVNGIIYAVGGYTATGVITSSVEAYNPGTNSWTSKASLPSQIVFCSAASIDGILYVVGGSNSSAQNNGTTVATVYAYDPLSNTWTTKSSMNHARVSFELASLGGKLYAAGGSIGNMSLAQYTSVEVYDPTTNVWSAGTPMPVGLALSAYATLGPRLYIVGGYNSSALTTAVYSFAPP